MKLSTGEKVGRVTVNLICFLILLIVLLPIIHIVALSLADQKLVIAKKVVFIPWGINFESYNMVFRTGNFLQAYKITIWLAVVGTLLNLIVTFTLAYPLSQKSFFLRRPIMIGITITMFFSGGEEVRLDPSEMSDPYFDLAPGEFLEVHNCEIRIYYGNG